jgi:cyclophilin family peptidyl-prolyl cis-trans isomerase
MSISPILKQSIDDLSVGQNAANTTFNLLEYFDDPSTTGRIASFELYNTSLAGGIINVLLFDQADQGAPLTVQNFLNYVNDGDYVNSIIHRSLPGFVIQGGGFQVNDLSVTNVSADTPVQNEFSLDRSNIRGTIAMAKLGGNPNSATNQWFFNLNDNNDPSDPDSLDNQNGGFTVFGQVLSQTDLNVIDAIAAIRTFRATAINPAFTNIPLQIDPNNPAIDSNEDYVRFQKISLANVNELSFSVVGNSNPDLVTPTISNNQLILDYADNRTGSAEIRLRGTSLLGETIEETFVVKVTESLKVIDFQANSSGFRLTFSREIDTGLLNLDDGGDSSQDSSDLEVLDARGQQIKGSLVWNSVTRTLEFVKTGNGFAEGNYTVTLFSRNDSFISEEGLLLDGNSDEQSGDNYLNSFSIDNSNNKVLSLPDFSIAPKEPVKLGINESQGIPIDLSDGTGVVGVDFTLIYQADLLGITGVNLNANLSSTWQITNLDLTKAGEAKISLQGTTSLSSGVQNLLSIEANVPETATYGKSGVLELKDVKLNGSDNDILGDKAIQQVARQGDLSGNGIYSSLDAALLARIVGGQDTGSDNYPNTDPLIFGDTNFDGSLSNADVLSIVKTIVGLE